MRPPRWWARPPGHDPDSRPSADTGSSRSTPTHRTRWATAARRVRRHFARWRAVAGADVDVPSLARGFSGAWPYQQVLAELAGIDDPLDERVVRAYWTGNELTDRVGNVRFGSALLERIRPQAGHYWGHLTDDLLAEASPTHAFHVFGVYPWSRLLETGLPEPLNVLDSCRIGWAEVVDGGGGAPARPDATPDVRRRRSWRWVPPSRSASGNASRARPSSTRSGRGTTSPCTGVSRATGSPRTRSARPRALDRLAARRP